MPETAAPLPAGLGAAVGGAIGGGRGAGIGAASGAVLGGGAGVANAQNAQAYAQQQYAGEVHSEHVGPQGVAYIAGRRNPVA